MTAPDHMLRKSENPCIEGGIQTCMPVLPDAAARSPTILQSDIYATCGNHIIVHLMHSCRRSTEDNIRGHRLGNVMTELRYACGLFKDLLD